MHGLLAGRTAKPYVDWSYGACLAAVGLALIIRLVATLRGGRETAAYPVPDRVPSPIPAVMPAMTHEEYRDVRAVAPRAGRAPRALPPGTGERPGDAVCPGAVFRSAVLPGSVSPGAVSQAPYLEAHRPSDLHPGSPVGAVAVPALRAGAGAFGGPAVPGDRRTMTPPSGPDVMCIGQARLF